MGICGSAQPNPDQPAASLPIQPRVPRAAEPSYLGVHSKTAGLYDSTQALDGSPQLDNGMHRWNSDDPSHFRSTNESFATDCPMLGPRNGTTVYESPMLINHVEPTFPVVIPAKRGDCPKSLDEGSTSAKSSKCDDGDESPVNPDTINTLGSRTSSVQLENVRSWLCTITSSSEFFPEGSETSVHGVSAAGSVDDVDRRETSVVT